MVTVRRAMKWSGDRPVASGFAATAAIWSLCVANGDLVTLLLDIEKEGDQIDRQRAAAPARAFAVADVA
jgi:hypothetical protein